MGSILAEVAGDDGDEDIIDICNQLMSGLKGYVLEDLIKPGALDF